MSSVIAQCLSEYESSEAIFLSPLSQDQNKVWRFLIFCETYLHEGITKLARKLLTNKDYYFFNFGLSSIFATLWLFFNIRRFDTVLVLWRSYFIGSLCLRLLAKLNKRIVVYHTDHAALTGG